MNSRPEHRKPPQTSGPTTGATARKEDTNVFKCPVIGTPMVPLKAPPVDDPDRVRVRIRKDVTASSPPTRPVYVDDERSRKAFAIAQKIADLRLHIKALEQEYRKVAGTYSDPNVDIRQLQFPFADKFVTVHQPTDVVKLFNGCARAAEVRS